MISVITPAYNSSEYVLICYNSLLCQTYSQWEWIVVDDCSTDATFAILQDIAARDARVTVLRNDQNSGAAVSRNRAIEKASGEYIAFLDADDQWLPTKLADQLLFMKTNGYDFTFTDYTLVDGMGAPLARSFNCPEKVDYATLLYQCPIGCLTVMIRRESYSDISMPLLRTGQDYALWLKLLRNGGYAHFLNKKLALYRTGTSSLSSNKVKKFLAMYRLYRFSEGFGVLRSFYVVLRHTLTRLRKYS